MENEAMIIERNLETYEYLLRKSIFELRAIGRKFKIRKPTTCKKHDLIVRIIGAGSGLLPIEKQSNRGAPVKEFEISTNEIVKIQKMLNKEKEVNVKINIKQENYKFLLQCIYLGNLVINGNKAENLKTEHEEFVIEIYKQFIENMPERATDYKFEKIILKNTMERKIADFCDNLANSVEEYFEDFQNDLIYETLADKIADLNYPVFDYDEELAYENLLAKNRYYNIFQKQGIDFIHIEAPKYTEIKVSKQSHSEGEIN